MILELDVGNSSAKWRLLCSDGVVARGRQDWRLPWADLAGRYPDIRRVHVVSVAGDADDEKLAERLAADFNIRPEFARTRAMWAGVTNSYQRPESMGADRWLAMLAAWRECGEACVVMDAGSALTVDVLDQNGQHVGGYIVAGLAMQQASLLSGTGRVRFDSVAASELRPEPGRSTQACVAAGALVAVRGAAEQALIQARAIVGAECPVFITGGDAPVLWPEAAAGAERRWHWRPDLVLDGLVIALPERD